MSTKSKIFGSLNVTEGITGSLFGTSSWAENTQTSSYVETAQTASYVLNAVSSSYALTASYAENAGTTVDTGSFVTTSSFNSFTGSYNTGSFTGSFTGDGSQLTGIVSSKWTGSNPISRQSDVEITGSFNVTGSSVVLSTEDFKVYDPVSDNNLLEITSVSGVQIASTNGQISTDFETRTNRDSLNIDSVDWNNRYLIQSDGTTVTLDWENGILTSSLHGTSSWSENSLTASYIETAQTASYVLSSSYALSSSFSTSSSFAMSASWAPSLPIFPFTGSALITGSLIVTGSGIFEENTTTEILRITQLGTGDALRVEDSTNPDATPTVITADGTILIGTGSSGADTKLYIKKNSAGNITYPVETTAVIENSTTNYIGFFAPDDSNSGIYMGSPSDSFGAVVRWGFNQGHLLIGAQQSGHGIRFTVSNKISSSLSLTPTVNTSTDPNAILTLTGSLVVSSSGATITGDSRITGSLGVTQNITSSRAFISASDGTISGSTLTVYGSGSTQPVFTIQGSSGELFSITDNLSGSLFRVNDISSLPILNVSSDNTILWGSFQSPSLNTTVKNTLTNSGSFTVYSLPTSSYDGAWFEYIARSGSNARAGQIMALWSASSVNFTEITASQFGDTSGLSFIVTITGSNFALTGSVSTSNWTIKTIVRSI